VISTTARLPAASMIIRLLALWRGVLRSSSIASSVVLHRSSTVR
jgi:hypothetical protein